MSLKNPVAPPGIDPGTVRLVAQRLSHYATPCRLDVNKAKNIAVSYTTPCNLVADTVTRVW
jgi:hypothetical protein